MVRAEYKHLKADEKEIMERFISKDFLPGTYEYDIHLSVPDPIWAPTTSEDDKKMWRRLMSKRIDALCRTEKEIWILEITPKVSRAAVGGLLLYKHLYTTQFSPSLPLHLGMVVAIDDTTYHPLLTENNIRLWVV